MMRSTRFFSKSIVAVLAATLLCAPLAATAFSQGKPLNNQLARPRGPLEFGKIRAIASREGVLVEWRTPFEIDNVGFNVYRERNGRREQINPGLIAGSALIAGQGTPLNGGFSYTWFDSAGTVDSKYFVEDIALNGKSTLHEVGAPEWSETLPSARQSKLFRDVIPPSMTTQEGWAAGAAPQSGAGAPVTTQSALTDQWALANQSALKIGVRTTGWYHITQAQMVSAGFNTSADAGNLRMFVNASEVAIRVNRSSGPLAPGDYVEFWGQGVDTTSTDTQMYWLVNGTQPGKRIAAVGELRPDATPNPSPTPVPAPKLTPTPSQPREFTGSEFPLTPMMMRPEKRNDQPADAPSKNATAAETTLPGMEESSVSLPQPTPLPSDPSRRFEYEPAGVPAVAAENAAAKAAATNSPKAVASSPPAAKPSKKKSRRRARRKGKVPRPRRNHAALSVTAAPAFLYTVERRDRTIYVASVLNGDIENFYGSVLTPINPDPLSNCSHSTPPQTLTVRNLETTALVPAQLEVAIQGVGQTTHQIRVFFNGVELGIISFFGFEEGKQTFTLPLSSVLEGTNTVSVVPVVGCPGGSDTSLVEYTRITYPRSLIAESNSLQLSVRSTQSPRIEGFTTPNVRVLDIGDPAALKEIKPIVESSGAGYAVTVPSGGPGKNRLLAVVPGDQFPQPASISLNAPSRLNANNNSANLLMISYKDFIPSLNAAVGPGGASLVSQRQAQGFLVKVIDVDDIYDEFSFGRHDPQAIKDFMAWATAPTHWTTAPQYVIFLGGASLDPRLHDPRNQVPSHADFVPTKLVDATYNETASDDWFVDFDNDGIPEVGVGRLPARTVADATLLTTKLLNFSPTNVPQSALLVSDDPGTPPFWDFESSNDVVQGILQPAGVGSDKVYRRLEVRSLTGTINATLGSATVTGTGTIFLSEFKPGAEVLNSSKVRIGTVLSISSNTSLTLKSSSGQNYSGSYYGDFARADLLDYFNQGKAVVNYSGHGQIDVWTGANLFNSADAMALNNANRLSFVVVMDCLNGYFQDPNLLSLSEALLLSPNGGAISAFASSGLTTTFGQRQLEVKLYHSLYDGPPMRLGDAIKLAKADSQDIDVRRTWIYFGDPTLKIR